MRRIFIGLHRVLSNLDWIVFDLECKLDKKNIKKQNFVENPEMPVIQGFSGFLLFENKVFIKQGLYKIT